MEIPINISRSIDEISCGEYRKYGKYNIELSIKQRFKKWYFFFLFFFNKILALGNWDESSTMIDTPGEKLKSMMEDSCIVKRTGTNATAREFILDEIRDLQCATSSSELFVIATRFSNRLENWFGPQYRMDPLLAWHFCRFLDFTNNYNDTVGKGKERWVDVRWRERRENIRNFDSVWILDVRVSRVLVSMGIDSTFALCGIMEF